MQLPFEEIYEELFPVIYRFVRLRIPNRDTDDVTAEIITKIWRALPKFAGKSSLKSWAMRIACHHVADYYRMRKSAPVLSLEDELNSFSQEDHSENLTTYLMVNKILTKLSESQVAAIQLRLVEGFSAAETAQILGISPQAVDSLLYRAKKSFRKYYGLENTGGKSQ